MAVGDLINAAFQRLHDKIEALEAELAAANESRRAWASAHLVEIENVGRLEAELAKQKKCIEAVRAFHIESDGVCIHCEWSWPCRTIRALADPAPQESHAGSLAGNPIQAKDDQC